MDQVRYTEDALPGFLCRLYEHGAVKIDTEKGFKLKLHEKNPEAPLSPFYFNLRVPTNKGGPLTESDVHDIAEFFYAYLHKHDIIFKAICPVPNAGNPFAKALQRIIAERKNRKVHLLELKKEEDAEGRKISGLQQPGFPIKNMAVLLVDDLISRSDSKIEAARVLRSTGCVVRDCLVFLDRQQGGHWYMSQNNIALHAIVKVNEVLNIYKGQGRITPQQYDHIRAYISATAV